MKNRRNYYRLLHVQPDAPPAVIKSSFTALMLAMKRHPDLGGDHDTAVLINEAHAVLLDPVKRAEYDRYLDSRQRRASVGKGPEQRTPESRPSTPPRGPAPRDTSSSSCPFCGAPYQGAPLAGRRCAQCGSPMTPPMASRPGSTDKRSLPRFSRGGEITLQPRQSTRISVATLQDLSLTGMCVRTPRPLPLNQVVRAEGPMLSAVARVVSCRPQGPAASAEAMIGLEFLALEFTETRGTFVSSRI